MRGISQTMFTWVGGDLDSERKPRGGILSFRGQSRPTWGSDTTSMLHREDYFRVN